MSAKDHGTQAIEIEQDLGIDDREVGHSVCNRQRPHDVGCVPKGGLIEVRAGKDVRHVGRCRFDLHHDRDNLLEVALQEYGIPSGRRHTLGLVEKKGHLNG